MTPAFVLRRCVAAFVFAAAGCTVGAGGGGPLTLGEGDGGNAASTVENDDDQDGGTGIRDSGKRDGASSDASTKDGATKDSAAVDAQAYATDPLNCGAAGHDCRGATCVDGMCTPEEIATVNRTMALTHYANELFMVHRTTSTGGSVQLARIAKTPGATIKPVIDVFVSTSATNVELRMGAGYAYYLGTTGQTGDTIHRVPYLSASPAEESINFYGKHIAVDETRLAFTTSLYDSFTRAHSANSDTLFPSITTDTTYRSLNLIDAHGSSLFGLINDVVYEIPFSTGASKQVATVPNVATHPTQFDVTKHAVYGVHFQYSNPVTCQTTFFDVWRAPRQAGATASVILSSAGWVPMVRADDLGMFYTLKSCNGGDASIIARREDGVSYTVAKHEWSADPMFTADDEYVYYVDWGKLYRAAR